MRGAAYHLHISIRHSCASEITKYFPSGYPDTKKDQDSVYAASYPGRTCASAASECGQPFTNFVCPGTCGMDNDPCTTSPADYTLIREDASCSVRNDLGRFSTLSACASACSLRAGCEFFIYGQEGPLDDDQGRCFQASGGMVSDLNYDFYAVGEVPTFLPTAAPLDPTTTPTMTMAPSPSPSPSPSAPPAKKIKKKKAKKTSKGKKKKATGKKKKKSKSKAGKKKKAKKKHA